MVRKNLNICKNKKVKTCCTFILACIIWLFVSKIMWTTDNMLYSNSNIGKKNVPFGGITPSNILVQQIKVEENSYVDSISILFATFARTNTNENTAKININGKDVFTKIIRSSTLKDNSFYKIEDINLKFNKNDEIYLVIDSDDGAPGNSITAWIRSDAKNGQLYSLNKTNGSYTKLDGEITMTINEEVSTLRYISEKYLKTSPTMATVLFIVLSVLIICLLYQLLNLKEEEDA